MIKIRNKRIALLLVLTMLATMFVGVGTASAAPNFTEVSSTYTWIEADSNQTPGIIKISDKDNWDEMAATPDSMKVEITLPEGVTFKDTGSDTFTAEVGGFDPADLPITFGALGEDFNFGLINVDSDVTGSISAEVKVWFTLDGSVVGEENAEKTVIARISSEDLVASAAKAKSLYIGSGQKGATVTVKEVGANAIGQMKEQTIKFIIVSSGISWDTAETDFSGSFATVDYWDFDGKVLEADISDTDTASISKIMLTPYFKVSPAASGEVKIRVSGDNIKTETFVVGNVSDKKFNVKVKNAEDDWVYRGQFATFDDVEIEIDPKNSDLDDNDWFSITLPDGVKFVEDDGEDAVQVNDSDVLYEGLIKSDKTVWFSVYEDAEVSSKFKLTDFTIVADANAALGDLKVTFAGAIEGEYVIGSVRDAFTVTVEPFALQSGLINIPGADIVITETDDGAMVYTGQTAYYDYDEDEYFDYGFFSVVLPAGVTWDGVPDVDVTDGDLEIGDVFLGEDHRILFIEITEQSNLASTITISDINYSVLNQPGLGDLNVSFAGASGYDYDNAYNIASSKPLAKVAIGNVATNPTAVYVIGAPTFTVNGAVQSVVTPSYIKDARTYLAIRDIATGLGIDPMNVLWDAANSKVTLIKGTKIVQVQIGSTLMNVNGVTVAMDVAPEISNGRTMLPAAFIAQAFGATASWDAATQTVTIK